MASRGAAVTLTSGTSGGGVGNMRNDIGGLCGKRPRLLILLIPSSAPFTTFRLQTTTNLKSWPGMVNTNALYERGLKDVMPLPARSRPGSRKGVKKEYGENKAERQRNEKHRLATKATQARSAITEKRWVCTTHSKTICLF